MSKLAICVSLALIAPLGGCYDAGDKDSCVGLSCPAGFQWPDGGEVRIEHVKLPDGFSDLVRITAFFVAEQEPDFFPPPMLGTCFVNSPPPVEGRVYIDAGDHITVRGGGKEYIVPRMTKEENGGEQVADFINRKHDIVYLFSTTEPVGDDFFNSTWEIETADEVSFSEALHGNYMPPEVNTLKPTQGVLQLKAGEDLETAWEPMTAADPDVVTGGVVLFAGSEHPGESTLCVTANDGDFTVPGSVIADLPPEGGIMQVGYASNQAVLTPDKRLIALWASECDMSFWQKTN